MYYSETRNCLSWFFSDLKSTGYAIKLDVPFMSILDMRVSESGPGPSMDSGGLLDTTSSTNGNARATFLLSQPPEFFVEIVCKDAEAAPEKRLWLPCQDWTTDSEASTVLQHELVGAAAPLRYLLDHVVGPVVKNRMSTSVFDDNIIGPCITDQTGTIPLVNQIENVRSTVLDGPDSHRIAALPYITHPFVVNDAEIPSEPFIDVQASVDDVDREFAPRSPSFILDLPDHGIPCSMADDDQAYATSSMFEAYGHDIDPGIFQVAEISKYEATCAKQIAGAHVSSLPSDFPNQDILLSSMSYEGMSYESLSSEFWAPFPYMTSDADACEY